MMMHRSFLALATALVFSAFVSVASANDDFQPKPGHYESNEHGRGHVSFVLKKNGTIADFRIFGDFVNTPSHMTPDADHKFVFHKRHATDNGHSAGSYSAHGVWENAYLCKGDFRHFADGSEHNSYHIWHAHWVSK